MWLTNSSVGRKLVMSLTGAFLILFVTFHVLMNAVAILWPSAYNVICEFLGANWYALVGTLVLAAGFVLHILYALWLTLQNRKARGNDRYAVTSKPKQVEWASQNMLVLGVVVVAFMIVHLIQFWAKMQLAEICHAPYMDGDVAVPAAAGTWFLQIAFGQWWTLPVYVIGFVALWFHMTHGFWSMFQTAGWDNNTWMPRLKKIGCWWASIVTALFLIEAVTFTVMANKGAYKECPVLQQQYREMMKSEGPCQGQCPGMGQRPEMGQCPQGPCPECQGQCPEGKGPQGPECKGQCPDCKGPQGPCPKCQGQRPEGPRPEGPRPDDRGPRPDDRGPRPGSPVENEIPQQ